MAKGRAEFSDLIEQFGVPRIIIPNTPKIEHEGSYSTLVGTNPKAVVDARYKTYYRRFKTGETEFLAVKSRIETWLSHEKALLEFLKTQSLKPVEMVYFYKDTHAWDYSTADWKEAKVAIATDRDVEPLNREDLLRAIVERRVVWVAGWSSMGDRYVDFHPGSADRLPADAGYHFLFDPPALITDEILVGMGKDYEWDEEFFNCYAGYFSRPFLLHK